MFKGNEFFPFALIIAMSFSSACQMGDAGRQLKLDHQSGNDCCLPISEVKYLKPAEHDLNYTNAVMVYPMQKAARLRVNSVFNPEVQQKYNVREGDYFSEDQGETWRFEKAAEPEGSVRNLGRHPADAAFVYRTVMQNGMEPAPRWLERSQDGGKSWQRAKATVQGINQSLEYFMLPEGYYHPKDPRIIFVYSDEFAGFFGKSQVVFRSEDGGESFRIWYMVAREAEKRIIAISPEDPQVIYINGSYGSILKSDNAGETFRLVGMNDEIRSPIVLEGDKVSGRVNLRDWPHARQILVHPYEPDTVFAVTERGVLRSNDGGKNWCAMNLGVESGGTMINIEIDPNDRKTFFVGTYFGLFRSRDDGCTWEKIEIFRRIVR